ncbi:DUF2334 domain-containing protein [Corynebacterium testudinoris]|uniref:DUF2334 domain-containing protein n=1 Tax=Corynebacterium testudinoris TaxID=136857 RepID=UPI0009FC1F46
MRGRLLVSISSIFSDTRAAVDSLVGELDREGIPVSLLIAPHIDGNWHLAKDPDTRAWLGEQQASGRCLILNGFDQAVQGRRSEFASLAAHEARLRLAGATRQMDKLGFSTSIFAPPRWRLSPGTLEVAPSFGFHARRLHPRPAPPHRRNLRAMPQPLRGRGLRRSQVVAAQHHHCGAPWCGAGQHDQAVGLRAQRRRKEGCPRLPAGRRGGS